MMERATATNKIARGLILILVLLSTALVVGCGGGGGGGGAASMGVPRGEHTATVLADGRVLIVGGQGSGPIASAEVYDPSTDVWTSAGSMAKGSVWRTTTLLKDGRLLSVGDSSIDMYDPSTGEWAPVASMIYPRGGGHTATLLEDGRVLVAGGMSVVDDTKRDVVLTEIYDPSTGEWTLAGDMTERRTKHKALLLKDGRVLVMGGRTTELYDPATGTWSAAGDFTRGHGTEMFSATLLQNGGVLVAGGRPCSHQANQPCGHADLFDPSTGEWSSTGDMAFKARAHTATLLNDGKVLVVEYQAAQLYDPATGVWSDAGKMSKSRGRRHTATLLEDARVLIAGGAKITTDSVFRETVQETLDSVEIYDPAKGW